MTSTLPLAARVISEGFLPARSALLQGPVEPVTGLAPPDRVRGMLLALAIGDALGNTSEGLTAADRESRYGEISDYLPNIHADGRRVGLPSDDSQLAFWTLESLLERGEPGSRRPLRSIRVATDIRPRPGRGEVPAAIARRASRPGIDVAPKVPATAR